MKFKYTYMTQTQIGQLFGVSSHEIGKWLVQVGLRDGQRRKPTREAHEGGYCETGPSGQQGYCWVWHSEKTTRALRDVGYQLVAELPEALVSPPIMRGPFVISASCDRNVLNGDGEVVVRTTTGKNAEVLAKLLNAADRCGTLERLLREDAGAAAV